MAGAAQQQARRPRSVIASASDDKQQPQKHEQQQAVVVDAGGASAALSPLTAPGDNIEGPSTDLAVIYDRLSKVCLGAGRRGRKGAHPRL